MPSYHIIPCFAHFITSINQSGKIITGIALRLDNDGGLIIDSNGSEIKVLAGDVTILKQ